MEVQHPELGILAKPQWIHKGMDQTGGAFRVIPWRTCASRGATGDIPVGIPAQMDCTHYDDCMEAHPARHGLSGRRCRYTVQLAPA